MSTPTAFRASRKEADKQSLRYEDISDRTLASEAHMNGQKFGYAAAMREVLPVLERAERIFSKGVSDEDMDALAALIEKAREATK